MALRTPAVAKVARTAFFIPIETPSEGRGGVSEIALRTLAAAMVAGTPFFVPLEMPSKGRGDVSKIADSLGNISRGGESITLLTPPSTFLLKRLLNEEGAPCLQNTAVRISWPAQQRRQTHWQGCSSRRRRRHSAAPPLPLAGVSIRMERGCQQNDRTLADGCRLRPVDPALPGVLRSRPLRATGHAMKVAAAQPKRCRAAG